MQMTPGVIRRIVQALPSRVMLKHEDWPGLEKISALRGFEADGSMRHIAILCGNNGLFLDYEMRGADGANTGHAFPDMLVDVVRPAPPANAKRRTTSSTPICRCCVTNSGPARPGRSGLHPAAARSAQL
ncbi:hypothetical protein [Ottowia sp.]|uniref:hypothetical protein n=1 Tax=Ottowia sp. TaxID=1898956 RepID=UPI0025DF38A7|nr:hypothetical protein [Ottowia sp.]